MEGNGIIPNGWPLGLGNTNSRIRVVGMVAPLQTAASCRRRPSNFSSSFSFSSSNLDTESTTSFFRDGSVSLGRLMGIEGNMNVGDERSHRVDPNNHTNNSNVDGFCVPFLHNVIAKITRTQTTSTVQHTSTNSSL